jgi:hypothetical protein
MTNDTGVVRIEVTPVERAAGTLTPERIERARDAMLDDGFVVFDDLLDVGQIDSLRQRMHEDIPELQRRAEVEPRPWFGHLQHQPPVEPEFLLPDVILHPVVAAVTRALMGEDLQLVAFTANTNLPGSVRQRVHCDINQLFPDVPVAPPAHLVVSNVPLVDTSTANAVELWPGTHRDSRTHRRTEFQHVRLPDEWLDEQRRHRPPVQIAQRKGSVLLRDARLWHGGVPNTSGDLRVMLAVCVAPQWYASTPLTFPSASRPVLEGLPVSVPADYTDEPFDYLDPRYSGLRGPQMRHQGRRVDAGEQVSRSA